MVFPEFFRSSQQSMFLETYSAEYKLVGDKYNRVTTRFSFKRPQLETDIEDMSVVENAILERLLRRDLFSGKDVDLSSLARTIVAR